MQIIDYAPCSNGTHIVACGGSSSVEPVPYIIAGVMLGVAVDVALILAEKAYGVVQYYLRNKTQEGEVNGFKSQASK